MFVCVCGDCVWCVSICGSWVWWRSVWRCVVCVLYVRVCTIILVWLCRGVCVLYLCMHMHICVHVYMYMCASPRYIFMTLHVFRAHVHHFTPTVRPNLISHLVQQCPRMKSILFQWGRFSSLVGSYWTSLPLNARECVWVCVAVYVCEWAWVWCMCVSKWVWVWCECECVSVVYVCEWVWVWYTCVSVSVVYVSECGCVAALNNQPSICNINVLLYMYFADYQMRTKTTYHLHISTLTIAMYTHTTYSLTASKKNVMVHE